MTPSEGISDDPVDRLRGNLLNGAVTPYVTREDGIAIIARIDAAEATINEKDREIERWKKADLASFARTEEQVARAVAAEATIAELIRERDHYIKREQDLVTGNIQSGKLMAEFVLKLRAANQRIAELKGALREFVTANYPPNQPILSKDEVLYFADKFLAALSTHTEEKP